MKREATAKAAAPISGSKLYQQRARAALPLLVRQAESGVPISYGDLAAELEMPNPRNLNYVLGSQGDCAMLGNLAYLGNGGPLPAADGQRGMKRVA